MTDRGTVHRVSAGPYTVELPANGVAILYENGERLPGGVGYLAALVQFAGEVIRLRERCAKSDVDILIETGRNEALEEAARVTLRWQDTACGEFDKALAIAAAIRALKDKGHD